MSERPPSEIPNVLPFAAFLMRGPKNIVFAPRASHLLSQVTLGSHKSSLANEIPNKDTTSLPPLLVDHEQHSKWDSHCLWK